MGLPCGRAERKHMVDEIPVQTSEIQLVDKPYNDVGKPPKVHRRDKTDAFILP